MENTLLLVDDEPNILRALERVFQEDGYRILTATSGQAGLEVLAKFPVQVIISDQRMPNMTGDEFLTQVRKLYPDTIRIILSGYSDFDSVIKSINDGAIYKFLQKPWEEEVLRQQIREAFLINAKQKEQEMQLIRLMNEVKKSERFKTDEKQPITEAELKEALALNQFVLYYQPVVKTKTGEIKGSEALVRWQHPKYGLLGPDKFIPLCEISELIIPLSEWVTRTACQQLKAWRLAGHVGLSMAVNISPVLLTHSGLYDLVNNILTDTDIPPTSLELEITESVVMNNIEANIVLFRKLKELGVKLSLDDFGTGYSSLSYLKDLPIQILKIDKSFIENIATDQNSAKIVTTIIALAKTLGLSVVAEGVEYQEQLDILKKEQCDFIQGFLFSRAIPVSEFTQRLSRV